MVDEKTINYYYEDNAKRLRKMVDGILIKFGGITDKDDFYSIANEVFSSLIETYKENVDCSFKTYLSNCLTNKIKSEITKRNAKKRTAELVYIDDDETSCEVADGTDFEEDIVSDETVSKYMETFSSLGKKIISMRMKNMSDVDIQKKLGITRRILEDEINKTKRTFMSSNKKVVGVIEPRKEKVEKNMSMITNMSISPDYRDDYISLELIKTQIDVGELLINHPNQRNDWMWNNEDISTLIATNLHGFRINPIIVCEESVGDGTVLNWIVDGKQRITSMIHFAYPTDERKAMRVSKKTEYAEIPYQTQVKDENGNAIRDEYGRPVLETKVFDIRGKRFCDFPVELQRKFKSFVFTVTRYVNCDKDMISYHIRRYNKGKAMNTVEKANTYLTDENASLCKKVAQNVFFNNLPCISSKQINNGIAERTVMDAIMAMNYRENWDSSSTKMYTFYNENGDPSDFALLDEYLTRIDNVLTDETAQLFTKKDAYLFIALFHMFDGLGIDDIEFNKFLLEFSDRLHEKVVDGVTFDDIGTNSTRDKKYVTTKLSILETLLDEEFGEYAA